MGLPARQSPETKPTRLPKPNTGGQVADGQGEMGGAISKHSFPSQYPAWSIASQLS